MGTTVAAAVVKYEEEHRQGQVCVAWAGDSRVYRLRRDRLEQLTQDHSRVWPLIEAGQLTWDQLRLHPERSRITNALTAQRPELTVSLKYFDLAPGDQLLLCSDGLSGEIRPGEIEQTLIQHPPAEAVERLIEKANAPKVVQPEGQSVALDGGDDNITAIVIELPGGQMRRIEPLSVRQPVKSKSSKINSLLIWLLIPLSLVGAGVLFLLMNLGSTVGNGTANSPSSGDAVAQLSATEAPVPTEDIEAAPISIVVAEADSLATSTDVPTLRSEATSQVSSAALAPTATRGPVSSPTAPPTATLLPTATPATTPTPTQTLANELSPPVLVKPVSFSVNPQQYNADSEIEFVWEWPGELTDDLSFELRMWLSGSKPEGLHDARFLKQDPTFKTFDRDKYTVTLVLRGAKGLKGTSSDYFWSVGLVQIEPGYEWLDLESDRRTIGIIVPKDGAGPNNTAN